MLHKFFVVKALSVPLILNIDFQKEHKRAIHRETESVLRPSGLLTSAKRTWEGKAQKAMNLKGNPF